MFNFYHYIICRWQTVGQLSCGQISICTATRIKMWRNVFPFCLGGFLLNRSRSQSWSPLDIWKSSQMCMNEFMINLDFHILGTDSLWADQSFYQFWWFIDWHWPGGWRRISSRYRYTEAGEWEQVNNHEDSVGDVINWSVSPAPPRPGPGLRHNSGLWKNVRSKSEHAPRLGPGVLHTYSRVTAAWCMQLRASNKHFSCPQL